MIELFLLSSVLMMQDQDAAHDKMDEHATTMKEEHAGVTGEARELFLLADEATRSVHSATFDMVREGTGSQASLNMLLKAHVVIALDEDGGRKIAISGMAYGVDGDGEATVTKSQGALTADGARMLDYASETLIEGPPNVQVFGPLAGANFQEFGHPAPFTQDETNGVAANYEGQAFVGEILCDVVWVRYANATNTEARWYFGAEDHLPRRVERLRPIDGVAGAQVQTMFNLKVNTKVDPALFAIDSPEGFTVRTIDPSAFVD